MQWDPAECDELRVQGFRLVRGLVSPEEIAELQDAVPSLLEGDEQVDGMHRERERSGAIRQVYLAHRYSPAFQRISAHPGIVGPVRQLLRSDVYVWHSKINVKDAFEGTVWLWHQDYGYWKSDGVEPKLISVMIFLDRATVNNGCLMVAAGSHRWGRLEHSLDEITTSYKQWCVPHPLLRERLSEEMILHITGEPGDVLYFDCNLLHGSGHNLSPLPRKTCIIAYNDVNNRPKGVDHPRPDWVVSRVYDPVH
jgi:L-proline 4-hydroxylase